ncbi:MAG: 8-amino-7-oxononanoate synthase [Ferrovum sp.]|nr:8-amino-7-oxononanoate synthase [Ferrovum sp.]
MNPYASRLADWRAHGLARDLRPLGGPQGPLLAVAQEHFLAFCSSDYLGLANEPRVREAAHEALERYGFGAGASALVCGYYALVAELEATLAEWLGQPRALVFSSGYAAHVGTIPALVDQETAVFSDALNHASMIDGVRLARPGQLSVFPHNDLVALEAALQGCSLPYRWILTEGVFSMDGDQAPLAGMVALAEQYDAWILLDDAHGLGVLGEQGRGSMSHQGVTSSRVLHMATLGKAMGTAGAFVAGDADIIEWIAQRARTHMFSTALPPMVAGATHVALKLLRHEEWRRKNLQQLGQQLQQGLMSTGLALQPSQSAIHPLILGDNPRAMAAAAWLRAQGLWVAAIRPPSVPMGTSRLRISLSARHTPEQVEQLIEGLKQWQESEHV